MSLDVLTFPLVVASPKLPEDRITVRGLHLSIIINKVNEIILKSGISSSYLLPSIENIELDYEYSYEAREIKYSDLKPIIETINELSTASFLNVSQIPEGMINNAYYQNKYDVSVVRGLQFEMVIDTINIIIGAFSQYQVYPNILITTATSLIYTGLLSTVRKRISGLKYIIDITLTDTGFAGIEGVDWTQILAHTGQTNNFRDGVRDGKFVIDCGITVTGFDGIEGVDWERLTATNETGSETTYRDGIRDQAYVIDKVLDSIGFSGTEDINWKNLKTHKPT